jgi:hypothetical protein
MRGRLPVILVIFVALALISMAVAVASNASAEPGPATPSVTGNWVRFNIPALQDLQAVLDSNGLPLPARDCAITLEMGGTTDTSVVDGIDGMRPRWFCVGYYHSNDFDH